MNYKGITIDIEDTEDGGWKATLKNGAFLAAGKNQNECIPVIDLSIEQLIDDVACDPDLDEVAEQLTGWQDAARHIMVTYQVPRDVADAIIREKWGPRGILEWSETDE